MSTASIQFIKGNGDDHNILEQFSLITDVTRKEKINNKITTTTAQLILDNLVCDLIAVSCVVSIKSVLNERSNACVECLIITIQKCQNALKLFIYILYINLNICTNEFPCETIFSLLVEQTAWALSFVYRKSMHRVHCVKHKAMQSRVLFDYCDTNTHLVLVVGFDLEFLISH